MTEAISEDNIYAIFIYEVQSRIQKFREYMCYELQMKEGEQLAMYLFD